MYSEKSILNARKFCYKIGCCQSHRNASAYINYFRVTDIRIRYQTSVENNKKLIHMTYDAQARYGCTWITMPMHKRTWTVKLKHFDYSFILLATIDSANPLITSQSSDQTLLLVWTGWWLPICRHLHRRRRPICKCWLHCHPFWRNRKRFSAKSAEGYQFQMNGFLRKVSVSWVSCWSVARAARF